MAISYTKTNWVDNELPAINAQHLNNIEDGIESCVNGVNAALPLSGGTMTGNITMGANRLTFTGTTTAGNHSIYTNQTNNYLFIEGVTEVTGNLICINGINMFNKRITNLATPTTSTDAANKQYVDDTINQRINSLDATEVSY